MLTRHNIISIYPILAKVREGIKVKNLFGVRNGGDRELDENYRFRLSNKVVAAVSGNNASIRQAVLSVPGVVDMSLIPRTHGNGTFTIFPRTQDPILSDGIMTAVNASVQSTIAEGSLSYVEAPSYLATSINIELRFLPGADKNALYANARLTVMDYINNLELGGEIVINEIIQRVMSLDDKIMDMNIPQFGFGFYERQTGAITSYTPLRLMNQRADWNQKWYTNANLCVICEAGTR
jgi:phage-related baseplate assembly protein